MLMFLDLSPCSRHHYLAAYTMLIVWRCCYQTRISHRWWKCNGRADPLQLCCAECLQWSIISSLSMQFDWWNIVPLYSVRLLTFHWLHPKFDGLFSLSLLRWRLSTLKWWLKNKSNQLHRSNVRIVFILTVAFSSGWLSIFRIIACVALSVSMTFFAICTLNCRFGPAAFDVCSAGTQSNTIGFHILCQWFFPIMSSIRFFVCSIEHWKYVI